MKSQLLLSAMLFLGACNVSAGSETAHAQTSSLAQTAELPLPDVPDTLRTPAERAEFILTHFWDKMNFADTTLTHNRQFLEQNFVNFINLYPIANPDSLPGITATFLTKITTDVTSRAIIYELIDIYLESPDSPMQNDLTLITFLEQWLKLPLNKYELQEPAYRLANALKNRPGTVAADFCYTTREDEKAKLSTTRAQELLLLFYNPDCDHCNEVIATIRANSLINDLIASGQLSVLAIYTEDDINLWDSTKASMPDNWSIGRDTSELIDSGLYNIPEMPGIYLLAQDKTVILRQPPLTKLFEALQNSYKHS